MKHTTLIAIVLALLLSSCTSLKIEQKGPNQYMASGRNAAGVFVNYPALKAKVIDQANKFAAKQGKRAVNTEEFERNRWIPGFPLYEYNFRLE